MGTLLGSLHEHWVAPLGGGKVVDRHQNPHPHQLSDSGLPASSPRSGWDHFLLPPYFLSWMRVCVCGVHLDGFWCFLAAENPDPVMSPPLRACPAGLLVPRIKPTFLWETDKMGTAPPLIPSMLERLEGRREKSQWQQSGFSGWVRHWGGVRPSLASLGLTSVLETPSRPPLGPGHLQLAEG